MEKRYQVFISSTYNDLREERTKVFQTIMQLDCIPAGMELFPAADEEQWKFIKRVINDCDYYLLIIGGRYGSLTTEGISFTEKEYDYAVQQGLKVIALIHGQPDQIAAGKTDKSPAAAKKLAKFREKASTGRLVQYWKEPSDLPGLVALSLSMTMKLYPAIGWVRANAVASSEVLADLNELRKRNKDLEEQLAKVQAKGKESVFAGRTYDELYTVLNEEKVYVVVGDPEEERETTALVAMIAFADDLARGVSNAFGASKSEARLFYGVATRLSVYGLTDFTPIPRNVAWQRLALTDTGKKFVAAVKAKRAAKKKAEQSNTTKSEAASLKSGSAASAAPLSELSEIASAPGTPTGALGQEKAQNEVPVKRVALKKAPPTE
ncbi:DUF4062 domain-containing protein [Hyalangium gracile]|uniref:DUF4062 domain-containing protein n=1 Tax=Hyalangium gracile TaxID=394092 RepID=UPI001CCB4646|nr:DUF4062 domain-containing protein [Hyalangium gracile]